MKIAFVGTGNVIFHLAPALSAVGHEVVALYARHRQHAESLLEKLPDTALLTQPDFTETEAELLIVSVSDDAYPDVVAELRLSPETLLTHTSGSQPMDVLKPAAERIGVFYPLQTFSKAKPLDIRQVLFCPEAAQPWDHELLEDLITSLGAKTQPMNSRQRQQVHLAAVFACNFSNLIWHIAEELLEKQGLDFALLDPLLRETLEKALRLNPSHSQTGPAVRGDEAILQKHHELLFGTSYQQLYTQLSRLIQDKNEAS